MSLKFYNGKRQRKHIMYFTVELRHILHQVENSTYQGCNFQSLFTKSYILLYLFPQKNIFSFALCLFSRKSQEQALRPPKLKLKLHPKGQERDNCMWGLVWENLSGAVLNVAWTCFHLTFWILPTSNIPSHQKLNADVKIKVTATWWKLYAGFFFRRSIHKKVTAWIAVSYPTITDHKFGAKNIKIRKTGQPL